MTNRERAVFWLFLGVFVVVALYSVKAILLPFVVAMVVAYFLDPAVDRLEDMGIVRWLGTTVMIVVFFAIMITLSFALVPVLYDQFFALIQKIPTYTKAFQEQVLPSLARTLNGLDASAVEQIKQNASNVSIQIIQFIGGVLANVWDSGIAVLNLLSLLFITPIVLFYLLRDWDLMVAKVNGWLPKQHADVIRQQFARINNTLSGYLRGQIHVCILLGIFYAVGLMLVGLEFGLVIGLMTGVLSFIPYVGLLFGMVLGLAVAFFQFGGMEGITQIGLVAAIFAIGQLIEGNFVTPKLVGGKVGLHPVWVMFALLAGGALMGFVGVLIAVPVAAVIGVLIRFSLEQYLASTLYTGGSSKAKTPKKRKAAKATSTKAKAKA